MKMDSYLIAGLQVQLVLVACLKVVQDDVEICGQQTMWFLWPLNIEEELPRRWWQMEERGKTKRHLINKSIIQR